MANIEIGGRLHSTATGNVVTGANEVLDDIQNKKQQEINAELIEAVGTGGSVDSRIAAAKAEIKGNATFACDTLGEAEAKINANATAISNEATRAEEAEEALDGRIDTLEETVENVAYLGDNDGSAVIADFDPQTDTVWKKAQVLSAAEKEQVQQNIGVREWLNTLTGEKYVSVAATDQTTTSNLKALIDTAAGSVGKEQADTIYRVGKWDGSAYNEEYYSDYAWDGSAYVQLNKKSIVGEVFDITEYKAGTKYADLAAALGTNGENVPQNVRKGGMSVKYVNTDNKYQQFRLMAQSFTIDETQWQDESNVIKKVDIVKYGDSTQRSGGGGSQDIGLLISSEGILKRINVNIAESSNVVLRIYDRTDGVIVYTETFNGSAGINHFSLTQNIMILPNYIVSVEGKVMYNSTQLDQIFYQYSNNQWSLRTDKVRFQYYIEVDESILNNLDQLQDEIDDINDYLGRNIETITIGDNTTRTSGGGSQNIGLLVPQKGQVSEIYCNVSGNGTIEVSVYDTDKSRLLITKIYSVIDGVNTISVSGLSVKQGDIISVKGNLYYNSTQFNQIFYQYLPNGQWSLRTDKVRFQVAIKIESNDAITELQAQIDSLKEDNIIYVGSNREIKKVTDALALGLQKSNSVIILDSEEFDIIDELGNDYMSQPFSGAEDSRGIELYNNITIKGTGNSVIKAHYLGDNADARSKFSVFNTKGSFTLDNIILDCKNIRYCVHDEQGNRTVPYKVQYLGCSMKIDNSENDDWPAMQCIGGGLGKNGIIIIKDCIFDAVLTTEYFRDSIGCVTYHNNGYDANSKSNLIVNGNYFKASTFALMWYGSSTKITECLLSNNSFETPILEKATNQSATVVNTKIISWNNIIRGVGN